MQFKKIVKVMANNAAVYGMSLTVALILSGCTSSILCFCGASSDKPENNNDGGVKTLWESDIPVSWIKDVIIVCLSIVVLVLFVKMMVWMARTIDRHCCSNYKKVLKETVSISDALMTLYNNYPNNQTRDSLQSANISLGRIKAVCDSLSFCNYNKKRMDKILKTLQKELSECNVKEKDVVYREQIAKSWQHVNEAIVEYLK